MNYQEKIRFLLKQHNCTIYALSAKLDIAKSTLNALEKGISKDIRSARNRRVIDNEVLRLQK